VDVELDVVGLAMRRTLEHLLDRSVDRRLVDGVANADHISRSRP